MVQTYRKKENSIFWTSHLPASLLASFTLASMGGGGSYIIKKLLQVFGVFEIILKTIWRKSCLKNVSLLFTHLVLFQIRGDTLKQKTEFFSKYDEKVHFLAYFIRNALDLFNDNKFGWTISFFFWRNRHHDEYEDTDGWGCPIPPPNCC